MSSGYFAHRLFEHLPFCSSPIHQGTFGKMYDTVLYQTCFSLLPLLFAYIFYQTSLPAISDKVRSTLEGLQLGVKIAFGSKTVHTPSSCPRPFFMFSTLNTESSLAANSRIVTSSPGVLRLFTIHPIQIASSQLNYHYMAHMCTPQKVH